MSGPLRCNPYVELVCECGDFVSQHENGTGRCHICWSHIYPPGCKRFVVAGIELRRALAETLLSTPAPEEEQ